MINFFKRLFNHFKGLQKYEKGVLVSEHFTCFGILFSIVSGFCYWFPGIYIGVGIFALAVILVFIFSKKQQKYYKEKRDS